MVTKNRGGLKKGQTNNPNGRPVGSKNKLSLSTKERIIEHIGKDFDAFTRELRGLTGYPRVKATIELIKLVVPRPITEEEKEGVNRLYGGLECLFRRPGDE